VTAQPNVPLGAPIDLEEAPLLPRWAAVALYIVIATGAHVAVAVAIAAAVVFAVTLLGASLATP